MASCRVSHGRLLQCNIVTQHDIRSHIHLVIASLLRAMALTQAKYTLNCNEVYSDDVDDVMLCMLLKIRLWVMLNYLLIMCLM